MTQSRSLRSLTLLATAVHVLIFAATALYLIYLGRNDIAAVSWSLAFYHENASNVMAGMVPYRDFPFEYPILSWPLFLLPRLLVSDLDAYKIAFVVEMLLWDAAAIYLIARHVSRHDGMATVPGRLVWYTLYCASLSPLVMSRFELPPMVLAFAAARWCFGGRSVLGGITAGLGTLMKIFPGVVAALALVWGGVPRPIMRVRGGLAFLVTLAVGLLVWLALGGVRALDSFGYHLERGLEVESLYGGAVLLFGTITGNDIPWVFEHKAFHVAPEWGARLSKLALPIQVAALLLVIWRFRRSRSSDGIRYSAAAICAFISFGNVLSPQYMIWLFPFVAAKSGQVGTQARQLFMLICCATALLYPGPGFLQVLDHQAGAILLLNLRNVLLIGLLWLLLRDGLVSGAARK
jgi:hypothetical protein